jgi:signal transduction histidine kinase
LTGIVGAAQDITEQKLAQEREANRQLMLEKVVRLGKHVAQVSELWTTLDRIWHGVHDDLGFSRLAIFLYNSERNSMDSTFGTDSNGMQVRTWGNSFPIGDGATFKTVLDKPDGLYFTDNYAAENKVRPGDEMYGVKDFAAVAVWGGHTPVAVICVDNSLSGNIISSDQLEALRLYAGYAGLAIENARLNSSLQNELDNKQTLIDELETKNAELERFTYTVSHDLKSPLVTIVGFLGYVEKDALAGNFERVRSGIERISSAAKKMERLLSDLLELSRIGRLMNPPENVAFAEIAREALERVRGRIEANRVHVRIEDNLPIVHGDRARLVEIVQNLLDNSAKFSAGNDHPCIEIGTKGQDENLHHILFVCDNGMGIDPAFHERIFGLFNKLNPQMEGTGIGLTLVKRIIEVHGGRIWVESSPGQGASFYFTLPAQTT